MDIIAAALGLVACIVVWAALFKPFFGDWGYFQECVRYVVWKPDFWSLIHGEFTEDFLATVRLQCWIGCGLVCGVLTYAWVIYS